MPHRNQCNSKALSALLHVSAHDRPANTSLGVGLGCENYHEMAEPVAHEHQLVKCLVAHEERLNPKKTIPLVPQVTGPFKGHFTSAGCVLN